jgi:membrane protease YdiL (CAAX protease family)
VASTALVAPSAQSHPSLVASRRHLLVVLAALVLNAGRSWLHAEQSRAGAGPERGVMYLRTIFFELVVLGIVAAGVGRYGGSFQALFGQRWESLRAFLRDLGIGLGLWLAALVWVSVLGSHTAPPDQSIRFLLPQNLLEALLWIALSIVAGISEEAVYRGYLQTQFTALTNSHSIGILASAIGFGAAHLYQGLARASVIAASAVLYGLVVKWRRSVRPGMFAHALQDAIAPALVRLMRH